MTPLILLTLYSAQGTFKQNQAVASVTENVGAGRRTAAGREFGEACDQVWH